MSPASFHMSYTWSANLQAATPFVAFAATLLALLAVVFIILVNRRLDRLTIGTTGSLEETLNHLTAHMKDTQKFRQELELYLKHTETRLRSTVRGVGVVRYNPFANDGSSGGNQSFTIAFLDETLSGVVFSALYSRDRVGVYAKPMVDGKSSFALSEEEQQAVEKASASLSDKKRV